MSASRLRLGEYLAALGAAGMLVALFALNWYCAPTLGGWRALQVLRWFLLASAVLAFALVLSQVLMRGPALAVTLDLFGMLLAGLTTILVAISMITTSRSLWTGAWVGVGSAALTTLGAYRAMRTEQGWTPGPGREIEVVRLPHRGNRG